jgi:hypothetical protein
VLLAGHDDELAEPGREGIERAVSIAWGVMHI